MRRLIPALAASAVVAVPLAMPATATATAHDGTHTLSTTFTELNDSGASGQAWVWVTGDQIKVKISADGLLAKAPHAQHIHLGMQGVCPPSEEKGKGPGGVLRTSDAHHYYGMIAKSLTTSGDSSPDSGLAVERFPKGDNYTYERTFTDAAVAQKLASGKGVIVVHGVDHNGNGMYDGPKSDLDPKVPGEATNPAMCGKLTESQMGSVPSGGVETGGGGAAASESGPVAAGVAAMAMGGVGLMALRRRRPTSTRG